MYAADIRAEARALADLARALVSLKRDDTGQPTEKPANDLGHATIRLSIALDDLASAAEAAYEATDARFEPARPVVDVLAPERAQLALLSAIFAGDFALDSFAWAELVRRKVPPKRGKDGKMPFLWSTLMAVLDADPTDAMTPPARYLDVTLDPARDALVAHRDPELWPMVGSGTGGWFTLTMIPSRRGRFRIAQRCLDAIKLPIELVPWFAAKSRRMVYSGRVEALVAASSLLDGPARKKLREAYRWGGFESPSMAAIASRFGQLIRLYLAHRGGPSATVAQPSDPPSPGNSDPG